MTRNNTAAAVCGKLRNPDLAKVDLSPSPSLIAQHFKSPALDRHYVASLAVSPGYLPRRARGSILPRWCK